MRKLIEGGEKIGNWIVVSEDSEIQSSFLETPNTLAQGRKGSYQKIGKTRPSILCVTLLVGTESV